MQLIGLKLRGILRGIRGIVAQKVFVLGPRGPRQPVDGAGSRLKAAIAMGSVTSMVI